MRNFFVGNNFGLSFLVLKIFTFKVAPTKVGGPAQNSKEMLRKPEGRHFEQDVYFIEMSFLEVIYVTPHVFRCSFLNFYFLLTPDVSFESSGAAP